MHGHVNEELLKNMKSFQRVNHFPGAFEITRKDHLTRNVREMSDKYPNMFDFLPSSYVLPGDHDEFVQKSKKEKGPWIIKPTRLSRGRGIYLIDKIDQVPRNDTLIISKV